MYAGNTKEKRTLFKPNCSENNKNNYSAASVNANDLNAKNRFYANISKFVITSLYNSYYFRLNANWI